MVADRNRRLLLLLHWALILKAEGHGRATFSGAVRLGTGAVLLFAGRAMRNGTFTHRGAAAAPESHRARE
jgi:hypothetical protein